MTARSLMARLALALGLSSSLHGQAVAAAKSVSLEKAPAAWVAYARKATISVTTWLNADAAPAPRMRDALARPRTGQPAPLFISLWMTPNGTVSRIEAKPSGDAQADADLRTVLLGRKLPIPPKNILQPMRLAIKLGEKKKA